MAVSCRVCWMREDFKAYGMISSINTSVEPAMYTVSTGSSSFDTTSDILFSETSDMIAEGEDHWDRYVQLFI